ncbi:MAG: bifunctional aldolase/short-chain dehydrogenase [Pseudomonadota bacterium]|nr:MAG: bifunctional aldolase/short-chain dehydrogenase [Pseudomonadota bacterium]
MQSLWNDKEAAEFSDELGLRVYTSRLLGREPRLVLHGGGNTSVKLRERSVLGDEEDILYVKGSGWDLETIDRAGFAPVRMAHLLALAKLPQLSDPQMVNELRTHMTKMSAPTPSVEAILHAILPHHYVDHTHADAVVTVTNTPNGEARVREIYGDSVVVVPYIMPGFDLARHCAEQFAREAGPQTIGMVLLNHGIFSFGASARESYERMIALVTKAEDYLKTHKAWDVVPTASPAGPTDAASLMIASLRGELSRAAGRPLILTQETSGKATGFCRRTDVAKISQQGPATPDHVIRTKPWPLVGRDVAAYSDRYRVYFDQHAPRARESKTMLDPAPRVILDAELGLLVAGNSAKDAHIVRDIYDHTIDIILRAEALGGYRPIAARDVFDMEYWDLEQAKLRKSGRPPMFLGEVALITGAASGIGKACVESLLARGAAVAALDVNPAIKSLHRRPDYCGTVCDVTDRKQLMNALQRTVSAFGGLDMLILNAGIFPGGKRIAELTDNEWQRVLDVNLNANLALLRAAHPLLRLAVHGARIVIMGSKNVPAPGPGAAAYSASKAALTQLGRVAALEWGADRIRVNTLHPDAVFDTGVWTEEVLAARAAHYGMNVAQYKTKNLLRTEVTSRDVAELAAELCGPLFSKTTGAQIPVDGGNDRVI